VLSHSLFAHLAVPRLLFFMVAISIVVIVTMFIVAVLVIVVIVIVAFVGFVVGAVIIVGSTVVVSTVGTTVVVISVSVIMAVIFIAVVVGAVVDIIVIADSGGNRRYFRVVDGTCRRDAGQVDRLIQLSAQVIQPYGKAGAVLGLSFAGKC